MTADQQLKPYEKIDLGNKKDQLQVFEESVLEHQGRSSAEDSSVAPLPESYPYRTRMSRRVYEREKKKLQIELLKVQSWVKESGQRIVCIFEGRDAAGKGGTIKRFMEHLNPRGARVVALEKPTETERGQWYFQRYIQNLPTSGEMVFFDRSWYNRAGVERVMGFCTPEQAKRFLEAVPLVERAMVESGIILIKYWLEVSPEEQERRLADRIDDGRKTWKLSPMDVKSFTRWDDYTQARDEMFAATDSSWAPWYVAHSEDKKRVRLNVISHLLAHVPYEAIPAEKVKLPKRKIGLYKAADYPFKFVPDCVPAKTDSAKKDKKAK